MTLESPAATLAGVAKCTTAEGTDAVSGIRVDEAGMIGGHRIYVFLTIEAGETSSSSRLASIEVGQGMENLPPEAGLPQYGGHVDVPVGSIADDATSGSLAFASLAVVEGPFAGVEWPDTVSGTVEWSCDPIPAGPTPLPPGAIGTATLSGAISGTFAIEGGDCPTPERPDGFMTGSGNLDSGEAILGVTIWPDATVSFNLYPSGSKDDEIAATGPASVEPAGTGWATHLRAVPTPVGPVTLDVEWSCGG